MSCRDVIDGVCLDLDDTVWYDRKFFRSFRSAVLSEAKTVAHREQIGKALRANLADGALGEAGFVKAMRAAVAEVNLDSGSIARVEQAIELFLAHPVELLPKSEACLRWLAKQCPIMVFSAGSDSEQRRKLSNSFLSTLARSVVVVPHKDETALAAALASVGWSANRAVVIGNSLVADVAPAIRVGCTAIWLDHEENGHGRLGDVPEGAIRAAGWAEAWNELRAIMCVPEER